jgi:TolB-like protein/Flp pilus assembly protein TadD
MAETYRFGPFRLDAEAEILFRGAAPIVLGQRAVALLRLLLECEGAPVAKTALFEAAWPGLAVEDSNLTVQIAALRRAFEGAGGTDWIETIPRRGYRYVGPAVERGAPTAQPAPEPATALPGKPLPGKPSVAVLPFTNLSGDPEQDYFADGMVEDITAGLSRIKWLLVIARPSSFAYKGMAVDVKRAGRELGARYLVQGSVRKDNGRVRVTAQMIEAETAGNLWTERFDRSLDDVFALQDEIALNVVSAIEPSLRRAEVERVKRKRPENLDAYDLLLRAISLDMAMPDGVARAMPILEQALALEPDYARAHGHLSMCHHSLYLRGGLREENRLAAVRHAHAAIASGQDDSTALTLAGFAIGMDGHDRAAAAQAFEAALALSPSSAFTYLIGSVVFGWGGDAERAIDWGERALRLSPVDHWNWFSCHGMALGHFAREHYQEAAAAARKAIQFNPGFSMSHMLLAAALVKTGRIDEAKSAAARVLTLQPAYRFGGHFAGVDCEPALAETLGDALRTAGIPE